MPISRQEREAFSARRDAIAEAALNLLCDPSVEPHRYHFAVMELVSACSLEKLFELLPKQPADRESMREALCSVILAACQRLVEI